MGEMNSITYRNIVEIEDWGAVVKKLIMNLGKNVPKDEVSKSTFKVHVSRTDDRFSPSLIEEGDRVITAAYVSDEHGNPSEASGKFVTLEMEVGPSISLGSPINYDYLETQLNVWIDYKSIITQQKDIVTDEGIISGLVIDKCEGEKRILVDNFITEKETYDDVTLTYAAFEPNKNGQKRPLIIWLHGMGEGGIDPTIPISANKGNNLASENIQDYFEGAYVLAPQTPTFWMDGFNKMGDGTSKYENALISLIKDYVERNEDIDTNRIYIGGDSNGGYMTMLMIRDYGYYFAAAFPVCEALLDELITDEEIERMKDIPIWLTAAKTDTTVPPDLFVLPTYKRLVQAGGDNIQLSFFDKVLDTSGLYKNEDGTPYEYNGHWSWIYVLNNECKIEVEDRNISIMEWIAKQNLISRK